MSSPCKIYVRLEYPLAQVKDPILYHLVTDYRLIPNIHRAKIDVHTGGTLSLHLEGTEDDIQAGLTYLRDLGIAVTEQPEDA